MNRISIRVFFVSFFLVLQTTKSDGDDVKSALLSFFAKLKGNNEITNPLWGWNSSSDPCKNQWKGVICDNRTLQVGRLFLDVMNLSGTFDPSILCSNSALAESLSVISLNDNSLRGENLDEISGCKYLTRLHLSGNQFSGSVPDSMSRLNNLKILDISNNMFSGALPDFSRISGLTVFLAQNNQFSGPIPEFDFPNFVSFNVSINNFSGPVPVGGSRFPASSYLDNPSLCGDPLPNKCPSAPVAPNDQQKSQDKKKSKNGFSRVQILMFSGYFLIGVAVVALIMFKFCRKGKKKDNKLVVTDKGKRVAAVDDISSVKPEIVSTEYKSVTRNSGASVASSENGGMVSQSLVILTSPEINGLKFEELLKAPAELLGRGKHGSVYKVLCEDQGLTLAVKRIKDWSISSDGFKQRMKRLDQVRHPNVLSPVAFYCSKQEKLAVYEYQPNGSLFNLLHGEQVNQALDWSSKLNLAATIAKALAFMHEELQDDAIPHGNLKSSNILLNQNMEPCMSEYGLMVEEHSSASSVDSFIATQEITEQSPFKSDIYAFGVILLEMLTGKVATVQNNGMDLAKWVVSVVREEWTGEVFDRSLIREGASEERMVNLLQIAIKCVNKSPEARPDINQVVRMINTIKEEDDRSTDGSEISNL